VRVKALAQNAALAAATTALFAGSLELGARLTEKKTTAAAPVADYIWDWREKMEGDFYVIRSEAVGWPPWEEINADGLRDRTHPVEKPPGTHRLVALGDSVTLGAGIKPEEAFPQVLERRLWREGRRVEVMNVGLWGWSTRQERMAYERIVKRYGPDQVLLAVCLNDIPELQNNLARPPALLVTLFKRSALVRRVMNAPGREIQNVEQLFTDREAPRVREAFSRFFDEVRALRDAVRKDGAAFGVALFPFRFQMARPEADATAQREIEDFCRREGMPFIDLLPALRPLGEGAFVDYDHLSPTGAERVAETLAGSDLLPKSQTEPEILAARLGSVEALLAPDKLGLALTDKDERVRAAATWALEQRGEKAAALEPALRRALGDTSPMVRAGAARALGAIGAPALGSAEDLFAKLSDEIEDVRWQAALALSRVGLRAPDAVAPLVATLASHDPYIRGFAAWSLGNLGPAASEAVPALIQALAQDDGYGRGGAATALARMGPAAAAAVPALLDGLKSPDGDRRWKAARTLGRIGPAANAAVPALAQSLSDPNEHVRRHAARALGRMGKLPGDAAAALRKAQEDADPDVRQEAREALAAKG